MKVGRRKKVSQHEQKMIAAPAQRRRIVAAIEALDGRAWKLGEVTGDTDAVALAELLYELKCLLEGAASRAARTKAMFAAARLLLRVSVEAANEARDAMGAPTPPQVPPPPTPPANLRGMN